jgi:peptidoglycan/LPS O-acetylase OafA/YrhL
LRRVDPRHYRADIDGFRAVSVVSVVLFHAWPSLLAGGFVGVDVSLVISGFLITRLLAADIAAGRFSLVQFYERRVRRIWPAFLAVVAATSIAATLLLMPGALVDFAHSVLASTVFGSNILFYQETDYWSAPAHTKPLLHTWSLSVEEQYYVVFPLLSWGIFRLERARTARIRVTLGALALASLVACIMVTGSRSDVDEEAGEAAFYLAPFWAWELLAGALLA